MVKAFDLMFQLLKAGHTVEIVARHSIRDTVYVEFDPENLESWDSKKSDEYVESDMEHMYSGIIMFSEVQKVTFNTIRVNTQCDFTIEVQQEW